MKTKYILILFILFFSTDNALAYYGYYDYQNSINNGYFDNNLSGWNIWGGQYGNVTLINQSAYISGIPSYSYIYQYFTIVNNTLSFDATIINGGYYTQCAIDNGAGWGNIILIHNCNGHYDLDVSAHLNESVRLTFYADDGENLIIDNITNLGTIFIYSIPYNYSYSFDNWSNLSDSFDVTLSVNINETLYGTVGYLWYVNDNLQSEVLNTLTYNFFNNENNVYNITVIAYNSYFDLYSIPVNWTIIQSKRDEDISYFTDNYFIESCVPFNYINDSNGEGLIFNSNGIYNCQSEINLTFNLLDTYDIFITISESNNVPTFFYGVNKYLYVNDVLYFYTDYNYNGGIRYTNTSIINLNLGDNTIKLISSIETGIGSVDPLYTDFRLVQIFYQPILNIYDGEYIIPTPTPTPTPIAPKNIGNDNGFLYFLWMFMVIFVLFYLISFRDRR